MKTNYLHVHRLRRVYVWELPVRYYHWLNALAIIALIITGFLIASPLALQSNQEATNRFVMGWVRVIHFIAAYIFFFNFLFRIYWGFVGNKYANWKQFIPTSKKFIKEMWTVFKIDILMLRGKEHISIGHNAMAGFIYFLTFWAFLIQCLTGFGLYASTATWWLPKLFSWVPAVFGGDILTRQVHHWTMWFFILFAVIHVYLVFYHDYVEGRGEISSMGGGWKFIEEDVFHDEEFHTPNKHDANKHKPKKTTRMNHNNSKTLILGIGNYLMGDEGIGVHTALQLQALDLPDYVEVVDGGTGGFHLLEYFETHKQVILIDATLDGNQPGNIRLIKPRFAKDFPRAMSTHDIGLKDMVSALQWMEKMPDIRLFVVSIASIQQQGIEMTNEVKEVIPNLIQRVLQLAQEIEMEKISKIKVLESVMA